MKTRSQSKQEIQKPGIQKPPLQKQEIQIQFTVEIDFDAASKAWQANKKSVGNGCYKYICPAEKIGKKCGKTCYKNLNYCWIHRNYDKE